MGFPGGLDGKESACNLGDLVSIPGSEISPGEGHGKPFQCACLEIPMVRGAWRAIVHGVAKKSDTTEQLTHLVNDPVSNIVTCGFKTSTYQFGRDRIQCTFRFIS